MRHVCADYQKRRRPHRLDHPAQRFIISFAAFSHGPERRHRSGGNRFTCGARVWFRNAGTCRRSAGTRARRFRPSAETARLSNYWKYNSKAVRKCSGSFRQRPSPYTDRPTWSMRPFDLPLGFKYATVYAGIGKQEKDDLSLIVSAVPAAAAAVFTTNRVQAAPVKLARARCARPKECAAPFSPMRGTPTARREPAIRSRPTPRKRSRSC